MAHPIELLMKSSNNTFTEKLLLHAIVRLSVTSLHSSNTFGEIYDTLRQDVFQEEKEKEAQKLSGPPVNKLNDGYVDQF